MRKKKKLPHFPELEIIDAGAKGKAVAKAPDGRVVFVTNAVPGDIVAVQAIKKRRAFYEGVVTDILKPSKRRVEPRCIHFGVCGGCRWQHMAYEDQLFFKQKTVENNLRRIGHLELPEIAPILPSKAQYFYRNKMEFSFTDQRWLTDAEVQGDKILSQRDGLGLHIPGRWDKVLDLKECHLQADPSNAIRLGIRNFAIENNLSFFNQRQQTGLLRTLMIRTASTGEVMVLIQFFDDDQKARENLFTYLQHAFPEISSLLFVINQKANDTLYDQEIRVYAGKDHIIEELDGLKFRITAKSFFQTNTNQAADLYAVVNDYAGLSGSETVYDLYSGTGTIGLYLAAEAKRVVGIETVPEAVDDARSNAALNSITNAEFVVGDMKDALNPDFEKTHGSADVVVVDPPRDGLHKDVVAQLLQMAPPRIVYVSCNSATQARDLELMAQSYQIKKVQPVDMFPQTHHVENVVLLTKRQATSE